MGCGFGGGYSLWWIGKTLLFLLGTLIFSYIFWKMKDWVNCKKPKKKK